RVPRRSRDRARRARRGRRTAPFPLARGGPCRRALPRRHRPGLAPRRPRDGLRMSGAGGAAGAVTPFVVLTFTIAGLVFVPVVVALGAATSTRDRGRLISDLRGLRDGTATRGTVPSNVPP